MKTDFKREYIEYMEFLGREVSHLQTEEAYKVAIVEEIENIISINGFDYLTDREKSLMELCYSN